MDLEFSEFNKLFRKNADKVFANSKFLFNTDIDKNVLWETYLESFPAGKNKIYRTRREYDCSCCRHFIKSFGGVVGIDENYNLMTLWDFNTDDDTFQPVLNKMSKLFKSLSVSDLFIAKQKTFGNEQTLEMIENQVRSWNHFEVSVPKNFITTSNQSDGELMGSCRDVRNVFERSLKEISSDAVQSVIDMIDEGNLYRGEEWKQVLIKFVGLQNKYLKIKKNSQKENFCWVESGLVGGSVAKIRNHSIGTLLIDLSEGVDAEIAVRKYEAIVAPNNYKRPKAIFTKKMIDEAQKTIVTLGFENSLGRRHARINDITIENVLWANRNAKKSMKSGLNAFDSLRDDVSVSPKQFENIQGISIKDFLDQKDEFKSLEVLLENRQEVNLFSLIAPEDKDSPSMFKWNNGFSWSYKGNLADSMKERVKSAGGRVDGVLRFSLQWNENKDNENDFDAHCIEPNGNEIYYLKKTMIQPSSGVLDVDVVYPRNNVAVENITWGDIRKMKSGRYVFFVHNYNHHGGRSGFQAEIEFNGELYEFSYNRELRQGEKVVVAEVILTANGNFSIEKSLPSTTTSKNLWGLKTNQFVPVSTFMFSPNYWDGEVGVGNCHYFFILNCNNDESPNGFYNEYLREDLMKHKKVFEALGGKMKVEQSEEQLSGIGFSTTKRDYVIVRIDNNRIVKVIF